MNRFSKSRRYEILLVASLVVLMATLTATLVHATLNAQVLA